MCELALICPSQALTGSPLWHRVSATDASPFTLMHERCQEAAATCRDRRQSCHHACTCHARTAQKEPRHLPVSEFQRTPGCPGALGTNVQNCKKNHWLHTSATKTQTKSSLRSSEPHGEKTPFKSAFQTGISYPVHLPTSDKPSFTATQRCCTCPPKITSTFTLNPHGC